MRPELETARFTTGQFARMHRINPRTLHYYDTAGIFSPAEKGENGYRYYTAAQSATLELLLTLRELGMPLEEVGRYLKKRSLLALQTLLRRQEREIETSIRRLREIRGLLREKEALLARCQDVDPARVELVERPRSWLLLSGPIQGMSDSEAVAALQRHLERTGALRLYNRGSYGTRIGLDRVIAGDFDGYDAFFTEISSCRKGCAVRPAGQYLRGWCLGDWSGLPGTYARMLDFAARRGLRPVGWAYETGINEMVIRAMDEYVTQVEFQVEPRG